MPHSDRGWLAEVLVATVGSLREARVVRDLAGILSLTLSIIAVLTVSTVGFWPHSSLGVCGKLLGTLLILCAPAGFASGIVGWKGNHQRLAKWGLFLGLFATLYVPTILLGFWVFEPAMRRAAG